MSKSNYDILVSKLDEFIRKYYKNQLIKGGIYFIGIVLAFYLLVSGLEFIGRFNSGIRTFLFFSFLGISLSLLLKFIVVPTLKIYKLSKTLSYEEAALLIGKHFGEVQDKLLNILQLSSSNENTFSSRQLVEAGINQKVQSIQPIVFTAAIDFRQNVKYLKYAAVPMLVFVLLLVTVPSFILDSTKRLVLHNAYFETPSPFRFSVANNQLQAIQNEDFLLNVSLDGNEIPNEIFVQFNGEEYKLTKETTTTFSYLFKNVQKDISFNLWADNVSSKPYNLVVFPKPTVVDFEVSFVYPAYVGRKSETVKNTGDITIPAGTKVKWDFSTQHTQSLFFALADSTYHLSADNTNRFSISSRFLKSQSYTIKTANELVKNKDSLYYTINVIPDSHPSIEVQEHKDTLSNLKLYFKGFVKDDYGFSSLSFNYKYTRKVDSATTPVSKTVPLDINKSATQNMFFHYWDLTELSVNLGDEIEYYFEVFDNDAVNGNKSARTQKFLFKAPTLDELKRQTEKSNSELKKEMEQAMKDAQELQQQIGEMNKDIFEKKQVGWEEKKKLENLLGKQQSLENKIEQIKQENQKNNNNQNEFNKPDEALLEKQQQLEKMFENLMTEDMKKLFKELAALMDKMDKQKVQETLDKMKLTNKDIEKELDRTLEVFKRMEVEKNYNDAVDKLNELAKEQEKLATETEQNKKGANEELTKKQQELNKKFDDVKKDIDALEKKNNELETPFNMANTDAKEQEVKQEMQNSEQQLQNNKNSKASQSQKSAAQKMQEMAQQMEKEMQQSEEQQDAVEMNQLRDILENLIQLSFSQEELMKSFKSTQTNNPLYVKHTQTQKKLKDDAKMIEDSLFALSKKVPQIESIVNKEISAINSSMDKAIAHLAERQTPEANARQQFAMTSINNLALMLSEALEQMQAQMRQKSQSSGSGSCNKPGGKGQKPSAQSMRQMQENLNKQIQKLKQQMEQQGKNPGGKKPGEKGSNGNKGNNGSEGMNGMSEELAKTAAQQEALRKALQQVMQDMKNNGNQPGGNLQEIEQKMEETETELVNKIITQETLKRQQEILTKLLEHENAERERDMDEKRESNEAKEEYKRNLSDFLEYKQEKEKEMELLKTVPPSLNPFYKNKVAEYFNTVD
ncbi:MAG: DUF4175 domain-containing protein [Bacteroidetes bacterium]|nr:DUF4175 domain-containing protein [Bacteroidota bacterium]